MEPYQIELLRYIAELRRRGYHEKIKPKNDSWGSKDVEDLKFSLSRVTAIAPARKITWEGKGS